MGTQKKTPKKTPQKILNALKIAELLSLSFIRKYQEYDVTEMMSISNLVIANCWKKRRKIKDWNGYVRVAILNRLKNYCRGENRKRKFMERLQKGYRQKVETEYSEVLDRSITADEKEWEQKVKDWKDY